MHFHHFSVMVDDQDKALQFYTQVLGFVKKLDIALGQYKWLTVVQPDAPDGIELLLEPNAHPAAQTFQKAMFADGIPLAAFTVDDIAHEHERLTALGVAFRQTPTPMGPVTVATFDDTCGNLIQLIQMM
jgi:catechol 2,3-dioxygenase-like lactoylglutathione lyase family enzyme